MDFLLHLDVREVLFGTWVCRSMRERWLTTRLVENPIHSFLISCRCRSHKGRRARGFCSPEKKQVINGPLISVIVMLGKLPWIGNTCASDPGPSSLSRTCSRPPGHTEPCKRSCPQRRSSPRPKCSGVPSGRCNSGGRTVGVDGAWVGGRVLRNQFRVGFTWHTWSQLSLRTRWPQKLRDTTKTWVIICNLVTLLTPA